MIQMGEQRRIVGLIVCALALCVSVSGAQVRATYLYNLSNFLGPLRFDGARVAVDRERDETYIIYQNLVRVFNPAGMEVFSFGDDLDLGQIIDVAAGANGDIILLSHKGAGSIVTRCSFRGVPVGRIEVTGLPAGETFSANRLVLRHGFFYFVSTSTSALVVNDPTGACRAHVDLLRLVEAEQHKKVAGEMAGFTVDQEGNVFFTVPSLFKVYKLSPEGALTEFGKPGAVPGKFGVLAGIVTDSHGDLLVADKLKCAIMVFDKDFNFITEFGYRGPRPENLVAPDDLAIDPHDRLYVTQVRNRGISVFALTR